MKRITRWIALLLAAGPALLAEKVPGRYIVELTTEPVSEHITRLPGRVRLQSTAASAHRSRIRTEQQQVRRELEQRQAQVLDSIDTVANALFVRIPDDSAGQLASTPGVKRVLPVRTFHRILDRAVVLHKVTEAWNTVGSEHAGEGVKIAIIDTGIDTGHPGLQDSTLTPPASFPRVNSVSDLAYTNGKVIVARSYVSLLAYPDADGSARDHVGHGTALAMIAAGVRNTGPLATITGVAPRAYLGNYKVFGTPGFNDSATDDAILKALDDAVADGMDIINLSLGDDLAPRLSDDLDVQAVERASAVGVLVVVAAGNSGPDLNTMSSPATAPSAIAVGATTNDRTFATSVEVPGLQSIVAIAGNGAVPSAPITAPITDVFSLDGDGRACSSLPVNSLKSHVALILRGTCTFETKLINVQQAGAVAGLVYAAPDSPDPVAMDVASATLPAQMISYGDGRAIQQRIAALSSRSGRIPVPTPSPGARRLSLEPTALLIVTLNFTLEAVPILANRLTDFSAAGPNVDTGIKPDLTAVGADIYVATQTLDPTGDMYDSSGYLMVDGTSFSAPLVAGAVALIKSARPNLTVDQYRSLLMNSAAATVQTQSGQAPGVQQAGSGLLDVDAALQSTVTAYPASLSFGAGGLDASIDQVLELTNVSQSAEIFVIDASPRTGALAPALGANTVQLAAGASFFLRVAWNVSGLAPGPYEGFLRVRGTSSGTQINVPYWYAASSAEPAHVTILYNVGSASRGRVQRDAILFRITDVSGVVLSNVQPAVTVVTGGGSFRGLTSYDSEVPCLFGIDLRLGASAGTNVFHIQAGTAAVDVSITGY